MNQTILSHAEQIALILDRYEISCPLEDKMAIKEVNDYVDNFAGNIEEAILQENKELREDTRRMAQQIKQLTRENDELYSAIENVNR